MFFRELSGLFFVVASIGALNKILQKNVYRFMPTVCRTDDCKTMANVILSAMNRTVDPCENFYEYACGAWLDSNETLPPNRMRWNRVEMFNRELAKKFRAILESGDVNENSVEKAKQWYRSCMDEESLEIHGIQPLTSLTNAVGGWPVTMALGEWNPSDYSWQAIERYYSRMTGSYAMYDLVIAMKWNNASDNKVLLKSVTPVFSKILRMPRKFFDPDDGMPYAEFIFGVARAFANAQGARVSDEKIAKEVSDMVEFEIKLHSLHDSDALAILNISQAQQFIDENISSTEITRINILKLVENLIEGVGEIEITDDEIIALDPTYLSELVLLLNETSFRTIVNYVHWHYLSSMLYTTNSKMRGLLFEFKKHSLGISEPMPRWEQCVYNMELNHALSYQFVSKYFTEETANSASEMVRKIQTEMEKHVNGSTWMDDETKNTLIDKLWNVKSLIGFPGWYKNSTNLQHYYEGLNIDNNYFNNVISYKRFKAKKMIKALRDEDDQQDGWLSYPITVNGFYIAKTNTLNIPAADFQPPIFTSLMPDSIKYGIVGWILGHELSHGFDDTGFHYGKNGELIAWPEETKNDYAKRIECFMRQYYNLSSDILLEKIEYSSLAYGEIFADTTGLSAVINAYKSVLRGSVKGDRKLPGLDEFSNEQLFFLSYATIWCESSTSQYKRKKHVYEDHHGSPRIRTLASLSNINEFAEAFNCWKGSPMNPHEKCNIWTGQLIEH